MASFVTLQRKYTPDRAKAITSLITKMAAVDMMPAYTVDGKDFESLWVFWKPNIKYLPIQQSCNE